MSPGSSRDAHKGSWGLPFVPRPARTRIFTRTEKKLHSRTWELSTGNVTALAGDASVANNFSGVGTSPVTLLRMRGEVMGWKDGVSTPPLGGQVTYGIILVPEGSGTTIQFDPVSDANAPWLLYGQAHLGYEEMVADVIDVPGLTSFRHVIDNKAMRIIRPDVEMQFVVANTNTFGAMPINLKYGIRWLQGF